MLPNHAPLVVAEQFGTLEALHPGRIDLGIGRAPGTDQATALALRRTVEGLSAEGFPQRTRRPDQLLHRRAAGPITATPGQGDMPAVWLLGSSGFSAQLAGLLGLPFSFAHHFSASNTVPALALYRETLPPVALARSAVRDGGGQRDLRGDRRAGGVAGRAERAVVPAAARRAAGSRWPLRRRRRPTRTPNLNGSSSPSGARGRPWDRRRRWPGSSPELVSPHRRRRADAHHAWCTTSPTGSARSNWSPSRWSAGSATGSEPRFGEVGRAARNILFIRLSPIRPQRGLGYLPVVVDLRGRTGRVVSRCVSLQGWRAVSARHPWSDCRCDDQRR